MPARLAAASWLALGVMEKLSPFAGAPVTVSCAPKSNAGGPAWLNSIALPLA